MKSLHRPRRSRQTVRRKDKSRQRTRSRLLSAAALLLALLAGALTGAAGGGLGSLWVTDRVLSSALFSLEGVTVKGNSMLTEAEVAESAGLILGQSILAADLETVRRRLLGHPLVRNAVVGRKLPSELFIEIEERTPAARVKSAREHVVDRDGRFLDLPAGMAPDWLPCFTGVEIAGGRVSDEGLRDLRDGIELVAAMRSFGFPPVQTIACIDLSTRSNAVLQPAGPGPLVHLGRDNVFQRLRRWKAVAADMAKTLKTLEYIDLRADGLVIARPLEGVEGLRGGEKDKG